MSKWADYLISAVKYNDAETHIIKVRVHADNDATVGGGFEMTRTDVIARIDNGVTFATIYKKDDGNWRYGASIATITIDGNRYIKTRADGTRSDNLENLPRF